MNQYNNTTKSIGNCDLLTRTKLLGIKVFKCFKNKRYTRLEEIIIQQLVRSCFSIGANYNEASECESRQDFIHKISVSKKEVKETLYWLDIAFEGNLMKGDDYRSIRQETHELLLIFAKIVKTSKNNSL